MEEIRHVQMYHSKTPELILEDIKLDLDDPNGDIRV